MHVKMFIYVVYFINADGCKYTFLYVFYCLVENKSFLYHFNKINVPS